MYYRYEARYAKGGASEWEGIFFSGALNPDRRKLWCRVLTEPKWYETHGDIPPKCWFTEYGYEKFRSLMERTIAHFVPGWGTRIVTCEKLDNIAMKGRVQYIELI